MTTTSKWNYTNSDNTTTSASVGTSTWNDLYGSWWTPGTVRLGEPTTLEIPITPDTTIIVDGKPISMGEIVRLLRLLEELFKDDIDVYKIASELAKKEKPVEQKQN